MFLFFSLPTFKIRICRQKKKKTSNFIKTLAYSIQSTDSVVLILLAKINIFDSEKASIRIQDTPGLLQIYATFLL